MTNDVLTLEYEPRRQRTRIYYGWVVVVVAALSMVSTFPGRSLGRARSVAASRGGHPRYRPYGLGPSRFPSMGS